MQETLQDIVQDYPDTIILILQPTSTTQVSQRTRESKHTRSDWVLQAFGWREVTSGREDRDSTLFGIESTNSIRQRTHLYQARSRPVSVPALARLLVFGVFLLGALAGCSFGGAELPARVAMLLDEIDMQQMSELTRNVDMEQVTALSGDLDQYLREYEELYELRPRPSSDPLGIAEAYMRQYHPGPLPRVFQTTYIYDRHGVRLAEIFHEGHRTWVPLNRISPHLINAVIATEDASFYTNPGFDARRVVGAIMQNTEAGEVVSGASTITMQLARQIFFTSTERFEQTMRRKIFETFLAQDLTELYSKDAILEMYLNLVHFGRLAYGIEAAAQLYFDKPAAELTLAEATLLAGIPQQPADYDLYRNFDLVKQRQRIVLNLMARHGYLTIEEANTVYAEEVSLAPETEAPPVLAPHFVQYVTNRLNQQMPEMDVRRAGMRVFTTLDLGMQNLAQQIVAEQVAQLEPRFDLTNAALVALKPGTAEILAMVGSANFDNPGIAGQVNVAVRSRQPGSAIKPILYATAIEDNLISPSTIIWDVEATYKISDDDDYRPENYDERFHGPVTVREALSNSYNVPAVKLLDAIGIERMLESARAMGLESLNRDRNWYGLSLTLGGGEVTLLDLTTAFHTLANHGGYVPPQAVLFTTGDEASESMHMGGIEPERVVSPETAFLITSILSDNEARSLQFGENSMLRISRPAVAKTGTTTDFRDNWTEGYTRYLVAGVWAGNSDGHPMRNASGLTGAAPIWNAFMEAVLADERMLALLEAPDDPALWEFQPPDGVEQRQIECPDSIGCPETEYYTESWMELTSGAGPLSDTMINTPVRTVFVNQGSGNRSFAACGEESDVGRQLVRMPNGLGRGLPWLERDETNSETSNEIDSDGTAFISSSDLDPDSELAKRIRQEQMAALSWSRRTGSPLYLGPCDQAEAVVRSILGNSVRSVAVGSFVDQVVVNPDNDNNQEQEGEQFTADTSGPQPVLAAATPPNSAPSSSYNLVGVAHDNNCSNPSVGGQVSNGQGAPVAGVRVRYEDDLGNVAETTTSSNAAGYGSFHFSVRSDAPHNIYITLLTNGGGSVSGRATVGHKQGGASDQSCHYVIWSGVD